MTVEAGVAIVSALIAGSVALLAFGLDSLIELVSASAILWLYTGSRNRSAAVEHRAQQLVAVCFGVLALYLTVDATSTLAGGSHPETSWPGMAVSAAAILVMPLLARAKGRVAAQLGSAATAGDAAQSWLCAITASGTRQHPRQHRPRLVVARPDHRAGHRLPRRPRGTRGMGREGLRRLRADRIEVTHRLRGGELLLVGAAPPVGESYSQPKSGSPGTSFYAAL